MTNIKEIIEKALNTDFTIKRYTVESVEAISNFKNIK
jgi:hypothetical protein|nr:MAG TPA: hypothetical protein [Caudoviricetes sp.]